ncbi:MAG: hypothetical protein ABR599_11700 [Gemmatimonadota bacterium]
MAFHVETFRGVPRLGDVRRGSRDRRLEALALASPEEVRGLELRPAGLARLVIDAWIADDWRPRGYFEDAAPTADLSG